MTRFPNNARVCFIGDSITHNNRYIAHIVSYYRTHFPEAKVEFYNCGISGGSLTTTLNCFDEDILPYSPTHAVIMIGINDSNRGALELQRENRYEILEAAFEEYKSNLEKLCNRLEAIGTEVILCTQTPYAEYIESDEPALPGGYALLLAYANHVKAYAKERNYPVCDYHTYMTRAGMLEPLFASDHVHPNERGHYYMAKCFLAFQDMDLGEETALPADIQKWHEAVGLVRNTIATEHFILHDDFTTTQEQRIAAIKDYHEHEQTGPYSAYFKVLAAQYMEIKAQQQENIQFTIDFMKN